MITDILQTYSDSQALTASAASTNLIDHGSDRNIGIGKPMAVLITIDVAAGGTSPTLIVTLQADDNVGFASPVTVAATATLAGTQMTAGAQFVLALPADTTAERYSRLNYTLGGTSPTVTLTAQLVPANFIQNAIVYPKGYTIS